MINFYTQHSLPSYSNYVKSTHSSFIFLNMDINFVQQKNIATHGKMTKTIKKQLLLFYVIIVVNFGFGLIYMNK